MSFDLRIKVGGVKEVAKAFKRHGEAGGQAVAAGMYETGLAIIADAVKRTPVDFGRLRASHYVTRPEPSTRGPRLELGFGTDYAVPVHENLQARHVVGEARFLKRAIDAASGSFLRDLTARAEKHLKRLTGPESVPASAPTTPRDGI